jgi:hypothetical protein
MVVYLEDAVKNALAEKRARLAAVSGSQLSTLRSPTTSCSPRSKPALASASARKS